MVAISFLLVSALVTQPPPPLYTPANAAPGLEGVDTSGPSGALAEEIVACETGGWRATECSVQCHVAFNFWTTNCRVSCRSGYMACCSCSTGCQCLIDHEEMWPLPPDPVPDPEPDPPQLD